MCKIVLTLLALIAPPIAVLFQEGCTCNLLINFLLTLLGVIPGVIHAWYILWCYEPQIVNHTTTVYVQGRNDAPPAYQ
ncbi:unnamed protein product [Auanema sp. JU1783]|nr:unnamed protein product [Auanema sp. JU1783]